MRNDLIFLRDGYPKILMSSGRIVLVFILAQVVTISLGVFIGWMVWA